MAGERIRFTSAILPKWVRRTEPRRACRLSLRGIRRAISGGSHGLARQGRANLSQAVIARLKGEWEDEYQGWQKRDLSARRYVYVWADGVYLQARMEPQAECMLVLIGATPEGKKELIGFRTAWGERTELEELLVDLKARGLSIAPEVAVGDGALGFWKALDETFPSTRHQRCWLHKTLNVLTSFQSPCNPTRTKTCVKSGWRRIETAETAIANRRKSAEIRQGGRMPDQGSRNAATFFDFPADHWHTNDIRLKRIRDGQASHIR